VRNDREGRTENAKGRDRTPTLAAATAAHGDRHRRARRVALGDRHRVWVEPIRTAADSTATYSTHPTHATYLSSPTREDRDVTTEDYRRALATAIREYEALGQQRQDIDRRLAEVMQTIGTLSRLCGLVPTVPIGLTDACRMVVRGAGVPVTSAEVRQRLQAIGFDLSRYVNDLAAIHTILKRLNEAGRTAIRAAVVRADGRERHRQGGLHLEPGPPCGRARRRHQSVHARRRSRARSDARAR
jgi:hypothetical protein